ncbi:MAG: class F sortase [Candidatus Dojkabacteria bacterium]|nr:class F sortase [Candidatus Dojkabacteria bacterium]
MVKIRGKRLTKVQLTALLSITFIFLGLVVLFLVLKDSKKGANPEEIIDSSGIVTISVDEPEETEPKEYFVAPDMPKRILIPNINVDGYIQLVGIDKDYRIAVPSNVHLAGWYINSAKPGEIGLSIMDGHRDGSTVGGVFRNIEKLKRGDEIQIEYGDGSIRGFNVVEVKQVSIEDAYNLMYEKRDAIERQLNLVSCGGKYSKTQKTYEDRIIVIAEGT